MSVVSGVFYQSRAVLRFLFCACVFIATPFSDACASEDSDGTYAQRFLLRQKDTGRCVAVVDKSSEEPSRAVDISDHEIKLQYCDEHAPQQRWLFDFQSKHIHSAELSQDLCLTRLPKKFTLTPCQPSRLSQLWYFNQRDELFNREDGSYSTASLSTPSRLTFQFVDSEAGEHRCYLSPFTGKVECPQFAADQPSLQKLERQSWHWSGPWPWQPDQMKLTQDIQLADRESHRCLTVEPCHMDSINQYDCFGGARVQVAACQPTSYQSWRYDLVSKRLFNKQAGEHFCLSWHPGAQLSLEHCSVATTSTQKWYFARGAGRHYRHNGRLRWFSKLEAQYDFIKALDFVPVIVFKALDNPECGYNPLDGLWQGTCVER